MRMYSPNPLTSQSEWFVDTILLTWWSLRHCMLACLHECFHTKKKSVNLIAFCHHCAWPSSLSPAAQTQTLTSRYFAPCASTYLGQTRSNIESMTSHFFSLYGIHHWVLPTCSTYIYLIHWPIAPTIDCFWHCSTPSNLVAYPRRGRALTTIFRGPH